MCQTFINDDKNFEEIIPTPNAITTQTNQSYWSKFEVCDCVYSILFELLQFRHIQCKLECRGNVVLNEYSLKKMQFNQVNTI